MSHPALLRRSGVALALAVILAGAAHAQTSPSAGQRLALHAKPAVVKIEAFYVAEFSFDGRSWRAATGGEGSGFFISGDGYVVTNAHVVAAMREGDAAAFEVMRKQVLVDIYDAYAAELRLASTYELRDLFAKVRVVDVKKHNNVVLADGTRLPYDIKTFGAPLGGGDVLDTSGKDCAIIKVNIKDAPTLTIAASDTVQLQDRLYVIGYPAAADLKNLDQRSSLEASITDGAVSAIKQTRDGVPLLQHSAPTGPGNSGGPALDERGAVVGIHSAGGVGAKAQGFNFVVGAATVREFVRQSGATTEPSETDALWREALTLFWQRRYTPAIGTLQEILTLFPAHTEAKKLLDEARELKRRGKEVAVERSAGAIAAPLIVLAVLVMIAVLARRRLRAQAAAPAAAARPVPLPPGYAGAVQPRAAPVMPTVALARGTPTSVAPTVFGGTLGRVACTRGRLNGRAFALSPHGLLIGRQPGTAQVVVDDGRVSAKHVWIGWDGGSLVAIDQGTTNGTFLNDMRSGPITRVPLRDGDVLIVAHPDCLSLAIQLG